ncbi:hypothetical protein [Pontibacter chitinilyticus]|uniref:hypothetical protein n=1 Tax=Pontibacter chitinilyticus TaxID=2674989 RepID=UPI003219980E
MKNSLKASALLLLLCFMLALASIGKGGGGREIPAEKKGADRSKPQASFSRAGQNRFQFLEKTTEVVVSSVNDFPAPDFKNPFKGHLHIFCTAEQRLKAIATQYLQGTKVLRCSLASTGIIFPFHYFW